MTLKKCILFSWRGAGLLFVMLAYNNCAPSFQSSNTPNPILFSSTSNNGSSGDLLGLDASNAFTNMSSGTSGLVAKLSSDTYGQGYSCASVTKGQTQVLLNRNVGPLTKEQYENSVNGIFGISMYNSPLPTAYDFEGYDTSFGLQNPSFEMVQSFFAAADQVIAEIKKTPAINQQIFDCNSGLDNCLNSLFTKYGRLLFKRQLQANEQQSIIAKAKDFSTTSSEAVEAALYLLLVSPQFTYHAMGTDLNIDESRLQKISELDLASRISFFLWGRVPDEKLLALAEENQLRNNLGSVVQEMIADKRSVYVARALAYNWFNMGSFRFGSKKSYSGLSQAESNWSLAEQVTAYINNLIQENKLVTELYSSTKIFHTSKTASIYGRSPAGLGTGFTATAVNDPKQSAGVLSHVGVLAQNSSNGEINVFNRGRFIIEKALCDKPIGAPAGELFDLSDKTATTIPQGVNALSQKAACAGCHRRMDPYGKGLEKFSSLGLYRESYSSNGDKIQYSDSIEGRTISGVKDLSDFIAQDQAEYVNYCATKNLLSLALSKNLFSDGSLGGDNKVGSCLAIDFYNRHIASSNSLKFQDLIYKIITDGTDLVGTTSKLGR